MLNKVNRLMTWSLSPVLLMASHYVVAEDTVRSAINMPEGVTPVSKDVYGLHMEIFWWCVAIGVVVFGVMFYSMIVHRKSNDYKAANFHESTLLEIVWTVIPFIILIVMAWPATNTLRNLYDTSESEVDVVVTGYQWYWGYEYVDKDVSFFSRLSTPQEQIYNKAPKGDNYLVEVDNPVVIPVKKKVRFLVTANDVIHSWWVPDLAVKRDAVPGYINESWTYIEEPGVYRGVCAELCGKDHGFMPIVVKAVGQEEYDLWIEDQQKQTKKLREMAEKTFTFDELMAQGEQVYNKVCVACHGSNGEGGVGKPIANSPIALGDLTPHLDIVINGSRNNAAMAAFKDTLSEVDTAAVITYQRNAFGNNKGDSVQPLQILKYKQGN